MLKDFAIVRTSSVTLHSHDDHEFHYITAGLGTYQAARSIPIRAGSFIISLPGEEHCVSAHRGYIGQIMFRAHIRADEIQADIRMLAKPRVFFIGGREAFFFEQLRVHAESGNAALAKSAFFRFLSFLYERTVLPARTRDDDPVSRCRDEIHRTAAGPFNLKRTAARIGVSTAHLIRSFKASTGQTPVQYRMRIKIDTAKLYLLRSDRQIADIAVLSGFSDELYFSRMFRKHVGMPPSAYRARLQNR